MNFQPILTVMLVPAVWLLKSVVYVAAFRVRKISATYLNCLIIAGAPLLLGGLIFIPLPDILSNRWRYRIGSLSDHALYRRSLHS